MAELKMVVGKKYRIKDFKEIPSHWNDEGKMDKWRGKTVTMVSIDGVCKIKEDQGEGLVGSGGWFWKETDFEAVKSSGESTTEGGDVSEKKSKKEVKKRDVAEIVREGTKIIVPKGMSYDRAIEDLEKRRDFEEKETEIIEQVKAFVWDGALAFQKAIAEKFGWADAQTVPGGFFSPEKPPKMIQIETGVGKTALVPWGRFELPGIEGYVETGMGEDHGKRIFAVKAVVKRKNADAISDLMAITRRLVQSESIYKGKAVKIQFIDKDGDKVDMPMPQFLDTSKTKVNEIILSQEVEDSVSGNLFAPIRNKQACEKFGIPLKRGILLSGKYGTGKTLISSATAKICEENKWTFLMVERANELHEMVDFAKQYQPAVVFCEDIDRVVEGERTMEMDDILNVIDGIESKNTEIIVVLTTNHADKINQAMMRPGRLDAVINVLPPDEKAVERLVRLYGRGLIKEETDLTAVGMTLAGKIPAVIRECVERSKLYAISDITFDGQNIVLTTEDLLKSALSMKNQLDLLDKEVDTKTPQQKFAEVYEDMIARKVGEEVETVLEDIKDTVNDIHEHVG